MWGGLEGEHRLARCGFAILLLGASVLVLSQFAPSEARAAPAGPATLVEEPFDPYAPQRSLVLTVPEKLEVGRRARVVIEGAARAGDNLSAFVDPRGEPCPPSAAGRPARAIPMLSETNGGGGFRAVETYRPRRPGRRSFCAYLGPSAEQAALQAGETRTVRARRLRAATARRTVVTALRRHGFARRVLKSVQRDCRRRSRSVFACRFSGGFPGYRLTGRGRVQLGLDLSYHFKVKAQGVRFTLTDDNEEPRPD